MKLTRRQKEILDFVTDFIRREGYSPSMEEIASHFHIASLNAVYKHLEALAARGHLHRDANRARSIGLGPPKPAAVQTLPLLGYIAAGRPVEAVANAESLSLPAELLPRHGSCYVLRVKGDSMIDDHIEDGDFVVIDQRAQPENGDTVVALVDGENVTLKKLFRQGQQVRLQPANPAVEPMIFDGSRVQVQGVVVAVMRKYK
jgi:repressor LexA